MAERWRDTRLGSAADWPDKDRTPAAVNYQMLRRACRVNKNKSLPVDNAHPRRQRDRTLEGSYSVGYCRDMNRRLGVANLQVAAAAKHTAQRHCQCSGSRGGESSRAFGFFTFTQCSDRPRRYIEPSRFETSTTKGYFFSLVSALPARSIDMSNEVPASSDYFL